MTHKRKRIGAIIIKIFKMFKITSLSVAFCPTSKLIVVDVKGGRNLVVGQNVKFFIIGDKTK